MPDTYVQSLQANLVGGPIDYIGEGHSTRWIEHDDIEHGQCRTRRDCDHTMMKEVHDACVIQCTLTILCCKLSFTNCMLRFCDLVCIVSRRGTNVTHRGLLLNKLLNL